MKTQTLLGALALAGLALCAQAAERRTYPCHRLASTPALDGQLDDEAWKNIPEATGFYVYGAAGKYAREKQTFFKAGWTADALYVNRSTDRGETFSDAVRVRGADPCECCATRAAFGNDGELAVF